MKNKNLENSGGYPTQEAIIEFNRLQNKKNTNERIIFLEEQIVLSEKYKEELKKLKQELKNIK
jgi:hypothetical protein